MSSERDHMLEEEARLKARYGALYEELLALFFRHDPMSLDYGDNRDEYSPEVKTILPRLGDCHSAADVCRVIHEEFQEWFGNDTGEAQEYQALAADVWNLWLKSRAD